MPQGKHIPASPSDGLPDLPAGVDVQVGTPSGAGRRIGIVAARFNIRLTGSLVSSAVDTLIGQGVVADHVHVRWVPGSFELPLALQRLAGEQPLDALIACGVVIEGETRHAELIMNSLTHHLHTLALTLDLPVIDAVVSAPSLELAEVRCGTGDQSRGIYAARTALECCR